MMKKVIIIATLIFQSQIFALAGLKSLVSAQNDARGLGGHSSKQPSRSITRMEHENNQLRLVDSMRKKEVLSDDEAIGGSRSSSVVNSPRSSRRNSISETDKGVSVSRSSSSMSSPKTSRRNSVVVEQPLKIEQEEEPIYYDALSDLPFESVAQNVHTLSPAPVVKLPLDVMTEKINNGAITDDECLQYRTDCSDIMRTARRPEIKKQAESLLKKLEPLYAKVRFPIIDVSIAKSLMPSNSSMASIIKKLQEEKSCTKNEYESYLTDCYDLQKMMYKKIENSQIDAEIHQAVQCLTEVSTVLNVLKKIAQNISQKHNDSTLEKIYNGVAAKTKPQQQEKSLMNWLIQ